MHIDEHVLAGYMAGELNDSERASVTTALLKDRSMREWQVWPLKLWQPPKLEKMTD